MSGPSTLSMRAVDLVSRLEHHRTLSEQVKNTRLFRHRAEQLEMLQQRLSPLIESAAALQARGIVVPDVRDRTASPNYQLAKISELFRGDRAAIVDPQRREFQVLTSAFNTFFDDYQQQLLRVWTAFAADQIPPLNEEVLNVLAELPGYGPTVVQMRVLLMQLRAATAMLPQDVGVIDAFKRAVDDFQVSWDTLREKGGLDPEIVDFVRSASTPGGALLNHLTPKVLKWLAANPTMVEPFRVLMVRS